MKPGVEQTAADTVKLVCQELGGKSANFNDSWPLNSWSIGENSNGYQTAYIRLLARFVK